MVSNEVPMSEIVDVARPIVERIVWCTVSTAGSDGVPRSRLMHPVWWWDSDVPHALVSARATPVKTAHLRANPAVACFYWDQAHETVAIDATAEWIPPDDLAEVWRRVAQVPAPVGFDPSVVWPDGPTSADCGFLRFTARRIVSVTGAGSLRWSARRAATVSG